MRATSAIFEPILLVFSKVVSHFISAAHPIQDANTLCCDIQTLQGDETDICARSLCDAEKPTFGKKLVVKFSQGIESDVLQLRPGSFLCKVFVSHVSLLSKK